MKSHMGYKEFHGAFAGPVLLVTCSEAAKSELIDQLSFVPSLGYMRGGILIASDAVAEKEARRLEMIDDEIAITPEDNGSIFVVLRRAAELGMIAGRGVPGAIQIGQQQAI